jgi:adenylate kinase family enzyme
MKHHPLSLNNGNAKVQAQPQTLIIMGVAGSGKSTVGKLLAAELGYLFLEGDDFHSSEAKAMMASGIPLHNDLRQAWVYRACVEGMFGVKGCAEGLSITPQLPSQWTEAHIIRRFRGAKFEIEFRREADLNAPQLWLDGVLLPENLIRNITAGQNYRVRMLLPLR